MDNLIAARSQMTIALASLAAGMQYAGSVGR
jgi:hypothetical protein